MVWGFCVYFVYMIPLETDVLRKHRFQKSESYLAGIQCWAVIGRPVKRHLMAFRWRADNGPLIVVCGFPLFSSTLKKKYKKALSKLDPL